MARGTNEQRTEHMEEEMNRLVLEQQAEEINAQQSQVETAHTEEFE